MCMIIFLADVCGKLCHDAVNNIIARGDEAVGSYLQLYIQFSGLLQYRIYNSV